MRYDTVQFTINRAAGRIGSTASRRLAPSRSAGEPPGLDPRCRRGNGHHRMALGQGGLYERLD